MTEPAYAQETETSEGITDVGKSAKPTVDKATMFCIQCGAVIPRSSKFCKECGAKILRDSDYFRECETKQT